MTPLTREYLEARGFHESSAIETGYRSQFTTTTEDCSYYLSLLSTSPLMDDLLERIENESFEVVISNMSLDNRRWATIPTRIIVSTVEQFEMLLSMLEVELKLIENNMTQEDKELRTSDKELLLKDLCARLPYGVKYMDLWNPDEQPTILCDINVDVELIMNTDGFSLEIEKCRPYLFPLSSMTEEQQEEFDKIYAEDMQVVADNLKNKLKGQPYEMNLCHYRHVDWLNRNHFDYRGLISKGLALDATGLNIY